jgi:hypothetical protein
MGSTHPGTSHGLYDGEWTEAGDEIDDVGLMPRARDIKDLLETLSSEFHSHTGRGKTITVLLQLEKPRC